MDIVVSAKNIKEVRRMLEKLGYDLIPAIVDASNRAVKGGTYTEGKRLLKEKWDVKQKDVKEVFRLSPASRSQAMPSARGIFAGGQQPLFNFGPRASRKGGVSALISGQRFKFQHAFIAEMASGHKGIFHRRERGNSNSKLNML